MKRIHSIPFILRIALFSMLVASCENEIPYNRDRVEPKLTMNAFIYADGQENRLYLSLTGETEIQSVGGATVEVTVNGERKEQIVSERYEATKLQFVDIATRFQPGDVVRIDARTHDGAHHAWVEETVLPPVEIAQVDTSDVIIPPKPFSGSRKNIRFKVRFQDRPNEKNYYRIVLEQRYTISESDQPGSPSSTLKRFDYWPWEDIALTDGRPATSEELDAGIFDRVTNIYGVFDDSWFKDSEYTLNVQIMLTSRYYHNPWFVPNYLDVDVVVRLLSITEIEFYYLTTMNMIDSEIMEDYISDPVKIPTNVHDGNGFVGISSESRKVVRVVEGERVK